MGVISKLAEITLSKIKILGANTCQVLSTLLLYFLKLLKKDEVRLCPFSINTFRLTKPPPLASMK